MSSKGSKRIKRSERVRVYFHLPQELLESFLSYCDKVDLHKDLVVEGILSDFVKQYSVKGENKETLFLVKNLNLVPYDLSLRLKEIGFNRLCSIWYDSSDYNAPRLGRMSNTRTVDFNKKTSNCTAPTYSECFDWLQTKYKVSIDYTKKGSMYVYFLNGVISEVYKNETDMCYACLTSVLNTFTN